MRRTLALAGAAVLTVGLGTLAGPASADPGITQQEPEAVLSEIAANLDPASSVHDYSSNFVELTTAQGVTGDVSLDNYELRACSATSPLKTVLGPADFSPDDQVPENGEFLIGDLDYAAGSGPVPDIVVSDLDLLEQPAGGVLLVDTTASLSDAIEWGSSMNCASFPDAGVSPDDDRSINRGDPWFHATPSPINSAGETN